MKYVLLLAAAFGCHAQTISSLTTELQRAPSADLYAERAAAYLASGDARAALADTDRALDKDAVNVRALTLRAQANLKLGRFSAAVTDLSGAIALAPTNASLYVARSEAYVATGDQPRALADRNEALQLDPNSLAALDTKPTVIPLPETQPTPIREATVVTPLPQTPAPAKPATKAPTTTVPAVAATPAPPTTGGSADSHYQRAKALLNQGKPAEAVSALAEAIKLEPSNPILYNTRGYAYYLSKDVKKALLDYDQAIKLNPNYLNATHNRAIARKAAGDTAGADADKKREAELTQKAAGK